MILRTHKTDTTTSQATYSDCEAYRYKLTRVWDGDSKRLNFIMLNPSVADEMKNDPTVARCESRARALGYGAFCVTNIFAWRDTDPHKMRSALAPVGPHNDEILISAATWADTVIAAWGVHGAHQDRGQKVAQMLNTSGIQLSHLGLTKQGHPKHPLYLPYKQQPRRWL
jgi:hypothetical protein